MGYAVHSAVRQLIDQMFPYLNTVKPHFLLYRKQNKLHINYITNYYKLFLHDAALKTRNTAVILLSNHRQKSVTNQSQFTSMNSLIFSLIYKDGFKSTKSFKFQHLS